MWLCNRIVIEKSLFCLNELQSCPLTGGAVYDDCEPMIDGEPGDLRVNESITVFTVFIQQPKPVFIWPI